MNRAALLAAGVPREDVDHKGAEMLAALNLFKTPHGPELERRATEAIKVDSPNGADMLGAAATTVRVARELAEELGLEFPRRREAVIA